MEYTDEQIAEMRVAIAAADAAKLAERGSYMDRAKAIIAMRCYTTTLEKLADLRLNYGSDEHLSSHVNAIVNIMQTLREVVLMLNPPEAQVLDPPAPIEALSLPPVGDQEPA